MTQQWIQRSSFAFVNALALILAACGTADLSTTTSDVDESALVGKKTLASNCSGKKCADDDDKPEAALVDNKDDDGPDATIPQTFEEITEQIYEHEGAQAILDDLRERLLADNTAKSDAQVDFLVKVAAQIDEQLAETEALNDLMWDVGAVHTDWGAPGYGWADFFMGAAEALGDANEPYGVPASELSNALEDQLADEIAEKKAQEQQEQEAQEDESHYDSDDQVPDEEVEEEPTEAETEAEDQADAETETEETTQTEVPDEDEDEGTEHDGPDDDDDEEIWVPPAPPDYLGQHSIDVLVQTEQFYGIEVGMALSLDYLLVNSGFLVEPPALAF